MKIKQTIWLLAIAVALFTACKKTKVTTLPETPAGPSASGTRAELSKDSIFLYAKEVYLWNAMLPTYETFNPRKFTVYPDNLTNYEYELFEITKYSKPYEYKDGASSSKYSYIFDKSTKNPTAAIKTASVDLEGNGNDFGVRLGFYGSETNYTIYATAIFQNSPAEKAGFVRGDKITKINNVTYGSNFSGQIDAISTALNGTTIKLEGLKSDGTAFNVTLTKAIFKSSPVYKSKVITAGAKKIGYLAYARFSSPENSVAELNAIFSNFATSGVTDLIIDLRYNGGGYISTAEHLINLIAPSATNNTVMFTEHYNALMQANGAKILTHQPLLDGNGKVQYTNGRIVTYADLDYSVAGNTTKFAKAGTLGNVSNIVFIVSGNTASASELVINSLKPHMTVKLVGLTTYGKPVGFFPITIENKYDVYYSLFQTKNSLGQGEYFDGIVPDYSMSEVPANTIMYDFGNPNDNYLKKAIDVLSPGAVVTSQSKLSVVQEKSLSAPTSAVIHSELDNMEFKGMVETRHTFKR
ncbi:MAG: S41 family peptidase [Pedobacter sp.]|nr:S41 family peptidase [Pedobacter sp.]MDQ8051395.1 S41 family peptidase [Pedobacter sp.]